MTNIGSHDLDRDILPASYQTFLGIDDPIPTSLDKSADELKTYAGRYVAFSRDLHVSVDGGGLMIQVVRDDKPGPDGVTRSIEPPPMRIRLYDQERIKVIEGPNRGETRGEFIRDADGSVMLLRFPTLLQVRAGSRLPIPSELELRETRRLTRAGESLRRRGVQA